MIDTPIIQKGKFLIEGIGLLAILTAGILTAAGQGIDTSGPDSAYCTGNGYLYTTIPGVNNGKPVCQFPDNSWCDAHSYFIGNCSASAVAAGTYNPYAFNSAQGALEVADATKLCRTYGGGVQTVHTSYGDVSTCVFPGGGSIDLKGLYSSVYGGEYWPGYYSGYYPGAYYGGYPFNNWYYGAYAWLNAP